MFKNSMNRITSYPKLAKKPWSVGYLSNLNSESIFMLFKVCLQMTSLTDAEH